MRQMITINDGNGTILARIPTDTDESRRMVTIERDGLPIYSLEIATDGTLVIGHWDGDTKWTTLNTDAPEES